MRLSFYTTKNIILKHLSKLLICLRRHFAESIHLYNGIMNSNLVMDISSSSSFVFVVFWWQNRVMRDTPEAIRIPRTKLLPSQNQFVYPFSEVTVVN